MRLTLVHAFLFACACALLGQSDRGTITGAVYPAASSGTGNYTIAQLPAGNRGESHTIKPGDFFSVGCKLERCLFAGSETVNPVNQDQAHKNRTASAGV